MNRNSSISGGKADSTGDSIELLKVEDAVSRFGLLNVEAVWDALETGKLSGVMRATITRVDGSETHQSLAALSTDDIQRLLVWANFHEPFEWSCRGGLCIARAPALLTNVRVMVSDYLNPNPQPTHQDPIDFETLAGPVQLIEAFGVWGLKPDWFKDPRSHTWLLKARKVIGKGARGSKRPPLYCPFVVMIGLSEEIRNRKRLSKSKGFEILEKSFPVVYAKFAQQDPRYWEEKLDY